ncbi:MAG: thiamine pyrophosphate-binding protein [Candidatus Puniceispirillaceae bacterium]
MTNRHWYEIIAEMVAAEGVRDVFALLGDANMHMATHLVSLGTRMMHVRHEHCAVAAAMAYARKSGQVGVATVTCGPGLTQVMTALPAAVRARIPLVVLAGEAPLGGGWYNQGIEQAPFVTATGAAYHNLHHPPRFAVGIRDAFLQARTEMRPVVVGIPFDLAEGASDQDTVLPPASTTLIPPASPLPPGPEDVHTACEMIAAADRIIIMAGLGAVAANAGPACVALGDRLDALLATTLPARGLFHDHPFNLGVAGGFSSEIARECFASTDLVIAVGGSLARHNADNGKLWPSARLLQIDIAPAIHVQGRRAADATLRADARLGVDALLDSMEQRPARWRTDTLAADIATRPFDSTQFTIDDGTLDPREVVAALEAHLPAECQLVNSSGHCSCFFAHMPSRPQTHFLTIREFGAIGNGISFAMGAAVAHPQAPVVLFDGDGSLMMHVQELETIKRQGLRVIIFAINDGAYGSEIHKLRADGLSDAEAVFGRPDFAAIATGFGIAGHRLTTLADLPALIDEVVDSGGPAVIDVPVSDKVISPVLQRSHG